MFLTLNDNLAINVDDILAIRLSHDSGRESGDKGWQIMIYRNSGGSIKEKLIDVTTKEEAEKRFNDIVKAFNSRR